jgi:hypothetical protein
LQIDFGTTTRATQAPCQKSLSKLVDISEEKGKKMIRKK